MAKCMQCGGSMKRAKVGTVVKDNPTKKEIRQAMRKEKKMDRKDKAFMKKYDKKNPILKRGGITQEIVGMPGYNTNTSTMKKGGAKYKAGGATKFGMLSVKAGIDNNPKATAADRIAGAKKNKRAKRGSGK